MKKNILFLVIGLILGLSIAAGATILYNAKDIEFTPNDASWNVDNMQDAINDIKDNYIPKSELLGKVWKFDYTGGEQTFSVPYTGTYKIELWGAQGGYNDLINTSGKGAYTAGNIELIESKELFVYVGGKGGSTNQDENVGGYNGGGYSGTCPPNETSYGYNYGGGGATDIRLVNGVWDNFDSLKSRIMVAAGGGGTSNYLNWSPGWKTFGGYAGGLVGQDGTGEYGDQIGGGATQTFYGINPHGIECSGNFGYAVQYITSGYAGGGGGGYYGGANGFGTGGGGGSSFISGYTGCNAIAETSTSSNIVHTGQPNHYSGMIFTDAKMIAGNAIMPTHDGASTMTGNAGNGYAKITLISID